MKYLFIAVLIVLAGCSTPHTRIIYSEAGGITSILTGKTKSCTVYSDDQDLEVEELTFNSGEDDGSCVGTLKTKE